jgi:hypothetical protein
MSAVLPRPWQFLWFSFEKQVTFASLQASLPGSWTLQIWRMRTWKLCGLQFSLLSPFLP